LTLHDGDVDTSSSAAEAIKKVESWIPDVIVSDIGMPNEDGYHLIRAIRDLSPERGGNIPAIALTGYVSHDDQMKALAEGYQMHLPKPVEIARLVTILRQLAEQSKNESSKTSDARAD
jgi:CheY-like chemotaxis protein